MACDASEHTRHAFVWCLSQLCQPDDVLVLIHVASRAEDESHENFSPNEESAASGGEEGSLDGARSGQDTEPETCSLSGGWKVLMKYIRICKQADLACMAVLTRGDPQTSFVEAATAHDCDLAVVGSRCIGAFKRAVKSSFSAYSVNHVTFPIVVVRWGIYPIENNLLNAVPPGLEESSAPGPGTAAAVQALFRPTPRRSSLPAVAPPKTPEVQAVRQLRESSLTDVRSAVEEEDCPSLEATLSAPLPDAEASAMSEIPEMPRTLSSASEGGSREGNMQQQVEAGGRPVNVMGARLYRAMRAEKKRRIAVGVDGSSGAKAALRWAIENYYTKGDVIMLINCQPLGFNPGAGYGAGSTLQALEQKMNEAGKKVLRRYSKLCQNAGIKAKQIIARGDPKAEIPQVAERHICQLTVVGAYGTTHDQRKNKPSMMPKMLSSLFGANQGKADEHEDVGSVCNAVVHRMHLPVVVVRKKDRPE